MTTPQFTRQADSTHAVTYATPAGELLTQYFTSNEAAVNAGLKIADMQQDEMGYVHVDVTPVSYLDESEADPLDAIADRLGAIGARLDAIAARLDAIASEL